MTRLDHDEFVRVVRSAPLVAIDLVVRDARGRVLLGLRTNEPAKDCWFVPGGRIRKGERLDDAFGRVVRDELGLVRTRDQARFLGVYEHFYDTNFAGETGFGTHYVVLVHVLDLGGDAFTLAADQHRGHRWFAVDELLGEDRVHAHIKEYFRG